jgi:hypothetical protein
MIVITATSLMYGEAAPGKTANELISGGSAMSYIGTFIQVSPDCPVEFGVVPDTKKESKPAHIIQYELLSENPYKYTHEELLFEVHVRHKGFSDGEVKNRRDEIWEELFQKKHPCLRACMLPKKYGWGVHYNDEGRIAIYPKESPEYQRFVQAYNGSRQLLTAMRSKRG